MANLPTTLYSSNSSPTEYAGFTHLVELSGLDGTGKSTLGQILAENNPGYRYEQTGLDYRLATFHLLGAGALQAEVDVVSEEDVTEHLDEIALRIANRQQLLEEQPTLYGELKGSRVTSLVAKVAQVGSIRTAVKEGFKHRIAKHVANPDVGVVAIDGRNLAPVAASVSGAEVAMRAFLTCSDGVAAQRQSQCSGVSHEEALAIVRNRRRDDTTRAVDKVVPDESATDYWSKDFTGESHIRTWNRPEPPYSLQVVIDTGRFEEFRMADTRNGSIGLMVAAFSLMIEGAVGAQEQSSLSTQPLPQSLSFA